MMTRILAKGYLWLLLALLYSPILIIMVFSFTEAKVLGNWTGFSTKLYSSLFTGGMHHSLTSAIWNTFAIAMLAATASTALGSIAAIGTSLRACRCSCCSSVAVSRRDSQPWYWRTSHSAPLT